MRPGIDFIGAGVCFFCHDGEGNVLMSLRSEACKDEQGRWDIGGGRIEFGEDAEEALAREIREEYLAPIIEKEFLGFRDVHREGSHWIALDFKVLVDRRRCGNGEPHKFDDVRWFPKAALPSPVHSQLPAFLAKYAARL